MSDCIATFCPSPIVEKKILFTRARGELKKQKTLVFCVQLSYLFTDANVGFIVSTSRSLATAAAALRHGG